jgi:chromosome segregation ATPase
MQNAASLLVLFSCAFAAGASDSNPLGTVIALMDELTAKITADGEAEAKAFKEYFEWCDDVSKNTNFDITTAKTAIGKLEAHIADLSSNIDVSTSKIEGLASAVAENSGELKSATEIRNKEAADFAASEKELADSIDALDRAVNILNREMAKNPAALTQIDNTNMMSMLQSLSVVVDAAAFSNTDRAKLLALAQEHQETNADEDDAGAPAAAVYKTHSTNIFDVLEDLKEKAEGELSALRKAESNAAHNYNMLKQSLDDQIAADTKGMNDEKASKAEAEEGKAGADGDLARTQKELKEAEEKLATANANCMTVAADHDATVTSRKEELAVVAQAKKILVETSSGAVAQTYSLFQISSKTDLVRSEAIALVKTLGKRYHSAALAQLASRLSAVARFTNSDDVFAKVKGLISDMIVKLEQEAHAEATEKAYCDEQMAKTAAKKSELDDDIARLTAKIDKAAARSAELKSEVKVLQSELAAIAQEQAEMDRIRSEEHADYVTAKSDLELGLGGVRKALSVLRDYYAADAAMLQQPAKPETFTKSEGAASSILGILEVCESDFATNLAKEESQEAEAASVYEKTTQTNKVTTATKEQDVKYKTQEFKGLDKDISELSSDRDSADTELAAVMEYYGKIKERCIAKPETYEERVKRRTAEINGLKEALSILENETALLQRKRQGHAHHFLGSQ